MDNCLASARTVSPYSRIVSYLCHMPIHTGASKTQFPKSESALSIFERIARQPWRHPEFCVTVGHGRYFVMPAYSVFSFHSGSLGLTSGRGIYVEANLCGSVATRSEMDAAFGRSAERVTLYRDRGRG